jgi:hypothetical protein
MRWLASELLSHQRARVRVDYKGRGVNPVDGATGVPYARRSVDGIFLFRRLNQHKGQVQANRLHSDPTKARSLK